MSASSSQQGEYREMIWGLVLMRALTTNFVYEPLNPAFSTFYVTANRILRRKGIGGYLFLLLLIHPAPTPG